MAHTPPDPDELRDDASPPPDAEEPVVGDAFDDPIDEDAAADSDPGDPGEALNPDDALSEALGDLDPEVEAPANAAAPKRTPHAVLCPYCGHAQAKQPHAKPNARSNERCDHCGGLFEPLSRKATQIAMGPWFLRDMRNPFRPGCSFEVVEKLIKAGQIGPTTVMRGPTTRQFWSIARNVPGVAHRLGYCHACGGRFEPADQPDKCPICDTEFKTPRHRNELGLAYPNRKAAESAQRSLDRQLALLTGKDLVGIDKDGQPIDHHPDPPPTPKAQPRDAKPARRSPGSAGSPGPADLLSDVLGFDAPPAQRPEDVSALDFAPDAASATAPDPARPLATFTPQVPPRYVPAPTPSYPPEPRAAAPLAPPHPNALSPVQPSKPWVIYLLVSLNIIVGLAIVAYFLLRAP